MNGFSFSIFESHVKARVMWEKYAWTCLLCRHMAQFAEALGQEALIQPLKSDPCSNYIILQRFGDSTDILFSFWIRSDRNGVSGTNVYADASQPAQNHARNT